MYNVLNLVSGMTIGLTALLLVQLAVYARRSHVAAWLSLFCLSCLAYLLDPYFDSDSFTFVNALRIFLTPVAVVAILGFAKCLFEGKPMLSGIELTLTLTYLILSFYPYIQFHLKLISPDDELVNYLVFRLIPQLLKIYLLLSAVVVTIRHIDTDLINARRILRFVFSFIICFYLIFLLLSELAFSFRFPVWMEYINSLLILSIWYFIHFWLYDFKIQEIEILADGSAERRSQVSIPAQHQTSNSLPTTARNDGEQVKQLSRIDRNVLDRLEKLMSEEKVYHRPALTIAELSKLVETKEYNLRKLINQHLGYRNFNTYLNDYRIEEATEILRDKERSSIPIFNLAMDVGFNSLAPFNRAFKDRTGKSPSDYRNGLETIDD